MKKFLFKSLSVFMAITLIAAQNSSILASTKSAPVTFDESVFSYDEEVLLAELSELDELDAYVEANEGVTFDQMSGEESPLVANMESTASPMGMGGQDDGPPLGIPSFLWGCVFGVVGLVIVYIMTDNNKAETKKAMWGCVASTAVSVVLYMVIWGAWAASVESVY